MNYVVFIDSDIIIRTLRKKNSKINNKAKEVMKNIFQESQPKITIFNYAELFEGTFWSANVAKSQRIMTQYLQKFELIHFNLKNSLEFARISAELEMNGNIIGDMDILIASIVIGNDDVLYTRNIKHFNKISSLKIINWGEDI